MSTRCITLFQDDGENIATIYRHCDGYIDGMGMDLAKFLDGLKRKIPATLLAANFVAALNGDGSDTLEIYPTLECASPEDMIDYMLNTDWEYAYIVNMDRDYNLSLVIISGREIVFSGKPAEFLALDDAFFRR